MHYTDQGAGASETAQIAAARRYQALLQRRRQAYAQRGAAKNRRRGRGQSLIIFALSGTVLLAMVGLAIDVARSFDQFAQEQRAAEAGALAAVLYMPNYYNTAHPSPDNQCAITRALQEVNKNGSYAPTATDCLKGPPSPTPSSCADETVLSGVAVTVCTVTGNPDAVQVTITEPMQVYLLAFLGFANITVTATARAEYINPFILGEPPSNDLDSYFYGNAGSCSNGNGGSSGCNSKVSNFAVSINGPAELKESGDPYVNCEEGPSTIAAMSSAGFNPPYDPAVQNPPSGPQAYTNAATGYGTNHPQSSSKCGSAQTDQQPASDCNVTCGTSHPGGYSYFIQPTTSATNNWNLWVFNPQYIPYNASGKSCPGYKQIDGFFQPSDCNGYYPQYPNIGPLQAGSGDYYFDDSRFYFNVTYTLYKEYDFFNPLNDTIVASHTFRPYDAMPADLSAHGCSNSQAYDLSGGSHYPDAYNSGIIVPGVGCASPITAAQNAKCSQPFTTPCPYQWYEFTDNGGNVVTLAKPDGPNCADPPCLLGYRLLVEATSYANDGGLTTTPDNVHPATPDLNCSAFTCGWGYHSYGIELCDQTVGDPNPDPVKGCTSGTPGFVAPLNNVDMRIIPASHNTSNDIPLANLDPTFAGRTIQIQLFDAGDSIEGSTGDTYFAVVPPDTTKTCVPVRYSDAGLRVVTLTTPTQYPAYSHCAQSTKWVHTADASNGKPADNIYNGLWINITIQLPPDYAGGEWWLNVFASQTNDFDEFAVRFGLAGGSPIHLF